MKRLLLIALLIAPALQASKFSDLEDQVEELEDKISWLEFNDLMDN